MKVRAKGDLSTTAGTNGGTPIVSELMKVRAKGDLPAVHIGSISVSTALGLALESGRATGVHESIAGLL